MQWVVGVIVLASVVCDSTGAAVKRSPTENYAVHIDAGSTSSKLKIYRWTSPQTPYTLPNVTLVSRTKFKPGLSEFSVNFNGMKTYLDGIINSAKGQIPVESQSSTPIFVMATAGFRFFPPSVSQRTMAEVRRYLSNSELSPFKYNAEDVLILSGEEEAVLAWIALNYLKGTLTPDSNETFGILEMGGGSTQIAFLPQGPLYAGEFQVDILGHVFQLYAQSYLNFGADGIQREVVHELLKTNPDQSPMENPCMLKGYSKVVVLDSVQFVNNVGTGHPGDCLKILRKIVKPDTGFDCQPKPCAVGPVYQPPVGNMTFFGTHAISYPPKDLNTLRSDGSLDVQGLLDTALSLHCLKNLSEVIEEYGRAEFASNTCTLGLYVPLLLNESYGFPMDTHNIKVASKINGQRIDWTLGAVLLEISRSMCPDAEHSRVRRRVSRVG